MYPSTICPRKTRQQTAVLLVGPNMFGWPCNLVVALLTFLVITIGQDAPSPSSMENTNCSNVTFFNSHMYPNCVLPVPEEEEENRNVRCNSNGMHPMIRVTKIILVGMFALGAIKHLLVQ